MRPALGFLFFAGLILSALVRLTRHSQPRAPVLGPEDRAWLRDQQHFVIGVQGGQVPLAFDAGRGMLGGHLY